ncbi:OPT oligopeptide transporter protein-domain-containing protein [Xylariales sp. AK1849]|nr:OPT oligopeptide transporter protein-domain-containing protein [Xylariales sp. AK1849]
MAGIGEVADDKVEAAPAASDPEKTPAGGAVTERIGDQMPHAMLEELGPSEAVEIIQESVKFHADDWNFPAEMRDRMNRIDAVLMRYSSTYPGVRSVAEHTDVTRVSVETFRAYFVGIGWAVVGTFMATFLNSRFPSTSLGGSVIQTCYWGLTVRGVCHSLNPGPWNFKEQMFTTTTYNIAIYTTNNFINFGYQLMLTLFVQFMGMGFAGYLRRFSVYPVKALWPTILPTIAMNRALTSPEPREEIYGWTMSRYKFIYMCTIGIFIYYCPENVTLATLTGSSLGLGLFNPITTFDWNVATSSYAALAQPFSATCTMYFGSILGGLIILLGIYYKNMYNIACLPLNSSSALANNATSYQVQETVVDNKLDETLYQQYSPPFYSAGYVLSVGANFTFYPVYFLYIMFNQWTTVSQAYVNFCQELRREKGNYEGAMKVHNHLMSKYPKVPDWWFLSILVAAIVVSVIFLDIYPLDTPVWLVFLMIAINLVFAVPLLIMGFILSDNPNAYLFAQTLGSGALAGYGDNYVQDQRMAHYIDTIIITCFVAVGTQDFILNNVKGLSTPDQPSKFTCTGDGAPLYASSLMWGLLGSDSMFNELYALFKWCFLIGTLNALLRPRAFELLDRSLFPFGASLLWLNPILIIQGIQHWAPSNLSYKTPGIILSFVFMYWLPRHRLARALTAGMAVSALIKFFAVD